MSEPNKTFAEQLDEAKDGAEFGSLILRLLSQMDTANDDE